jgi:hypothetical protein
MTGPRRCLGSKASDWEGRPVTILSTFGITVDKMDRVFVDRLAVAYGNDIHDLTSTPAEMECEQLDTDIMPASSCSSEALESVQRIITVVSGPVVIGPRRVADQAAVVDPRIYPGSMNSI